jgi:hypothetical protein
MATCAGHVNFYVDSVLNKTGHVILHGRRTKSHVFPQKHVTSVRQFWGPAPRSDGAARRGRTRGRTRIRTSRRTRGRTRGRTSRAARPDPTPDLAPPDRAARPQNGRFSGHCQHVFTWLGHTILTHFNYPRNGSFLGGQAT